MLIKQVLPLLAHALSFAKVHANFYGQVQNTSRYVTTKSRVWKLTFVSAIDDVDWRDREGTAWSEADVIPVFMYEYLCQLGARIIHHRRRRVRTRDHLLPPNNNNNNTARSTNTQATTQQIFFFYFFFSCEYVFVASEHTIRANRDVQGKRRTIQGERSSVSVTWRGCWDRPSTQSPRNHLTRSIRARSDRNTRGRSLLVVIWRNDADRPA